MQKYCFNCMNLLGSSPFCGRCGCDSRAAEPSAAYHLPRGTMLANRYIIGKTLGEGGFGITYIGMDTTLSKRVAVKEFYPAGIATRDCALTKDVSVPQDRERFFRKGVERFLFEAKSVAAFSDEEGIVNVQDYFHENKTAYIVMDYLDGENLKQYVVNHGVFAYDEIVSLLIPVMKALKAMHARHIIHRDISPDNIMFTKKHLLKLTDFGSAKYITGSERQKSIVLKLGFAPEEQYRRNGRQGPYTDVYALCATIYYCITGKVPVPSLDRTPVDTIESPSQLGAHIRPSQEKALMRGLAVLAQDRTPDMDALLRDLTGQQAAVPLTASGSEASAAPDYEKTLSVTPSDGVDDISDTGDTEQPPKGKPASPNEYADAWRKGSSGGGIISRTRRFTESLRRSGRFPPAAIAVIVIPVVLIIGLIIGAIMLAGTPKPKPADSAVAETTLNIQELLSGIDSHPRMPATDAASGSTSQPETTSPRPAVTYDECRQRIDSLNKFFFDNIYHNDPEARFANTIQLRKTYYSEYNFDNSIVYIAFVYFNATSNYYKVMYLPANSFSVDGDRLISHTTYMSTCSSGTNQLDAISKCGFLSSMLYTNSVL